MTKHFKKDSNKKKIALILQFIFILMLIVSAIQIIKWYRENKENKKLSKELLNSVTINVTEQEKGTTKYNVDFKKLKEENSDIVAWLKVEGTNIEYPVVKSEDNSYYLNHNFEKEYNDAGWIFADYKNKFDGTDKNIVIYGHNRRNGSMFGSLENILNSDWYDNEENRKIVLVTENENSIYEVFSVYRIKNEDYYITTDFNDAEFASYIETVKNRTVKDFEVDVTDKDNILTLSTCADNNKYRVVLHAKKLEQ